MRESQATTQVIHWLTQRGYLARKIHGSIYSAGLPDMYACRDGVTVFFEVKLFKGELQNFTRLPVVQNSQLESLKEHQLRGRALYLFIVKDGRRTWVMDLAPHLVEAMIRANGRFDPTSMCKEATTWMRERLPEIFKSEFQQQDHEA